jgi:capsular polysaccharide biosynthesis protein
LPLVLRRATPEGYVKVLESLGWDRRRIIRPDPRGISIFPRLYTTSWPLQQRSTPIDDLFGVFKRTQGRRTLPPGKGERIFISREGIWKRPLSNEPEIRAIFERRGFRVVRPELLNLQEARDLFANADIVGGAYGSAYMNFAYAPEPPTAMVLMPPETEHFLDEIALWLGACGARFAYLFGDPAPGRDKRAPWTAPAAQVEAGLDELLAQLGKA